MFWMAVFVKEAEFSLTFRSSNVLIPISQKREPKLLELIKKSATLMSGSRPPQYKLKFVPSPVSHNGKLIKCELDCGRDSVRRSAVEVVEKVLMVVGATGAGKTTLINGFANYIYGVEWESDFRLRVIKECEREDQSESQTKSIMAYTFPRVDGLRIDYALTIIDTPGFGDTGGISRDREIAALIKDFFSVRGSAGIDQLHGVLFVTPASLPRLTATQMYVFEAVLGIFGADIKDNVFLMTTFADGQKPQVLSAVKKANVPYNQFFKFNNSALYADNSKETSDEGSDSSEEESFDKLSWKMGMKSFDKFFKKFSKIEARSLVLTREVLREREHLQLIILEMPKKIMQGLATMDTLRQEETVMRAHESDVLANKNFTYQINTTKQRRVDLQGSGVYVTNCLVCNYTCHDNCAYANDCDKHMCSAMEYNADIEKIHCGVCSKKCGWRDHVNNPYRFELYEEIEERTSDELRQRYEQAASKKSMEEQIIDGIKKDLKKLEEEVVRLINKAKEHLQRLHEIALRPINLSEVDYIDLLIEQEKNEGKPGFLERIKALEGFRKQAELVSAVSNVELSTGNSVFEQLRCDDAEHI